jgi:hypothetical protein
LPGGEGVADAENVAITHFPTVEAHPLRQHVQAGFDGKRGLVGAESAHGPARRIVGVNRQRFHIDMIHAIRPAGVPGSSLQHLGADRRICPLVTDQPGMHRGQSTLFVAPHAKVHLDRMPLGVQAKTLRTGQHQLHRRVAQLCGQRRLRLNAHVFFAAERASVGHQLDRDRLDRTGQYLGDLPPIVEHPLARRVDQQAIVHRFGDARFRFEEQVLDALGVESVFDHVCAAGKSRLRVAAFDRRLAQQVSAGMDLGCVVRQRGMRAGDRLTHCVVDLDQRRGMPRGGFIIRDHDGQNVAHATGLFAHRDQHRPILLDQSDVTVARHVSGGDDARYAGYVSRGLGVDTAHQRPRMIGEAQGGAEHARHLDVVDVWFFAQYGGHAFVARQCRSDPFPRIGRRRVLAAPGSCVHLHRVDDLRVPGAATKVGAEPLGDLVAGRRGIVVHQADRPGCESRNAKPALNPAARDESLRDLGPLLRVRPFQRGDRPPVDLPRLERAGQARLAVDPHRAATALGLRFAAVLGRDDVEVLAQHVEQAALSTDSVCHFAPVEREGDRFQLVVLFAKHAEHPLARKGRMFSPYPHPGIMRDRPESINRAGARSACGWQSGVLGCGIPHFRRTTFEQRPHHRLRRHPPRSRQARKTHGQIPA